MLHFKHFPSPRGKLCRYNTPPPLWLECFTRRFCFWESQNSPLILYFKPQKYFALLKLLISEAGVPSEAQAYSWIIRKVFVFFFKSNLRSGVFFFRGGKKKRRLIAGYFKSGIPQIKQEYNWPGLLEWLLCKIQPTVCSRIANTSLGARQLGWANCLASVCRITLAGGTTFLHINALARLTGTALNVASVTKCLDLGFNVEIRIKEVEINSAKPTLIEWPRKPQRKRNICTLDHSIRVMINHAGAIQSYRGNVFTYKRSNKLPLGVGLSRLPETITGPDFNSRTLAGYSIITTE